VSSAVVVAVAFPSAVDVVGETSRWVAVSLGIPSAVGKIQLVLGLVLGVNGIVFSIPSQQDLRLLRE